MSWLFTLRGNSSGNNAEVDASNQVLVRPATTLDALMGYIGLAGRSAPGAAGTVRARAIHAAMRNRVQKAVNTYLLTDTFAPLNMNTSNWAFFATTQTGAQTGGIATLNNSGLTTANSNSAIRTTRQFGVMGNTEVRVVMPVLFAAGAVPVANNVFEMGLLNAALPGVAAPTEGIFFRYNAAAELRGVVSYNGTETQTAAITPPASNVAHEYQILISDNMVEFWIDDEFRAAIALVTDAPSFAEPTIQMSFPLVYRNYIGATPPATAVKPQIFGAHVLQNGVDLDKPWPHVMAGMGRMAYQGQNGGTMGTTAQYANSSNPAAAVPTNTAASLGSGLGGKFQETLTLAAATEGIISSFQNPVGAANQPPRVLHITGVGVSGVVTAALTTNPLAGVLGLCFGHTAVSLATTETGSFTSGGAKAPRRIAIGTTSIASATAAIGTPVVGPIPWINFATPVVVMPGEFIAVTHTKVGAAPATGAVMWSITFDGYFE